MKKVISVLCVACMLALISCGDDKDILVKNKDGKMKNKTFQQYGLFDQDELKDPRVQYKVIPGNVVWAVILSETVIVPIILIGWYLWEPKCGKEDLEEIKTYNDMIKGNPVKED